MSAPGTPAALPATAQDWAGEMGQRWLANLARFEGTIAPIGEALLVRAAYQPGERVVDIGCGGGATSLAIAQSVAPGGEVLGIDVSPDLVAATTRRAAADGMTNARFLCADAASVVPDGVPFDRLCSRFGSMFFADSVPAFANLRRLLKPGGRIDLAVWAAPAENPWMIGPMQIVRHHIELPAPIPRGPGPFAFEDLAYLEEILTAAGFYGMGAEATAGLLSVAGPRSTPSDALGFMLEGQSFGTALTGAGEGVREQASEALLALFAHHHQPDRGVMMGYKAWLVTAWA
jgi:SAM-dependent methyltransferase